MFGQGFGVVGEIAGRLTVQLFNGGHAQRFQQLRHGKAPRRIYRIHHYPEIPGANGFHIHQRQGQNGSNMLFEKCIIRSVLTQLVHGRKVKVFAFG